MSEAVLGFSKLSVPKIILRTRQIVDAATGNTAFTTPDPTLPAITTSVDLLEKTYNASRKKGPALTNVMKLQLKSHRALMVLFRDYVQVASGGDATKIESLTLTVKGGGSPIGLLGKIVGLKGDSSVNSGESDLSWKSEADASSYVIQTSADGGNGLG